MVTYTHVMTKALPALIPIKNQPKTNTRDVRARVEAAVALYPSASLNDKASLSQWYGALLGHDGQLPILSPAYWPEWTIRWTEWLLQGQVIADLGCGDGHFAAAVASRAPSTQDPKELYLVDLSPDLVRAAVKRAIKAVPASSDLKIIPIVADIERISKPDNRAQFSGLIDRVMAINTLLEMRADVAMRQISRLMSPSGLLCVTVSSKEFYDEFWAHHDESYVSDSGDSAIWITPTEFYTSGDLLSRRERGLSKTRFNTAYRRVQRYYTKQAWERLVFITGYRIEHSEDLVYPQSLVEDRWGQKMSLRQRDLIRKWRGFKEGWLYILAR